MQIPLTTDRATQFEHLVMAAADRLLDRLGPRFPGRVDVVFTTEELPPESLLRHTRTTFDVPLGQLLPGRPATVVLFRRPIELRAKLRRDREALLQDVMAEQVGELLGLPPDEVDPHYGDR